MILLNLIELAKSIYQGIAFIISPPLCFACKGYMVERKTLCDACDRAVDLIVPKMFKINETYFLTVYAVSRYTEPLRPMLFAKYRSDDAIIEKLADIIWEKSVLPMVSVDCLIPIPLHWSRNIKRGFNQAEILANRLSLHSKIPVVHGITRVRSTDYQVKVDHSSRVVNVKNSMQLNGDKKQFEGKHVMLVDDSCTTGATALEAARALVACKPASITMIVACRAL